MTDLGNFQEKPLAVGSTIPENKKVEIFEDDVWKVQEDFPFVTQYICRYSFISFDDAAWLFGKLNYVAKFSHMILSHVYCHVINTAI